MSDASKLAIDGGEPIIKELFPLRLYFTPELMRQLLCR